MSAEIRDWKDASVPCPMCGRMLPKTNVSMDYFRGNLFHCPKCEGGVDWFSAIRKALKAGGDVPTLIFGLIGAEFGVIVEEYELGRPAVVKLRPSLVPLGAEILDLRHGSEDEANEVAVSEIRPLGVSWDGFADEIGIIPVRQDGSGRGGKERLIFLVAWMQPGERSLVWHQLMDACREFSLGRLDKVVVPANVAMEISSGQFLELFFEEGVVPRKKADDFLQNAATYSHQLNILIPLFAKQRGLPILSSEIRGKLNELRSYRNDLAHRGHTKQRLTREMAADFIAAAILGHHYLRLAGAELEGQASGQRT